MLAYYFIAMILILGTYFVFFGLRQPEAAISESMSNNKKDFMPSNKFAGAKQGYVFKMDDKGLGYYLDYKSN
jgi:L-asparagine transporter-like permease